MNQENQPGERRGLGAAEKAAIAAIGVNALLTGLKFLLAWWSGSLSLKVEAFHSFADIGSSIAVFFAVSAEMSRKSREPSPAGGRLDILRHPQRLVSIFIGIFLAVVGILFIRKVFSPEPIEVKNEVPVALAMLFLALFSFLLSRLERLVGEREDCTALVADSFHARVDMAGSLLVAGALLGNSLGLSLDRPAAGLLAAFILLQSLNVFGAVLRDMARGEASSDIVYREWLFMAVRKRLPSIIPRLVGLVARLLGGSAEDERARRRAGVLLAVLIFGVLLPGGYLAGGLFSVNTGERAIVERLGVPQNPDTPLGPGLHWEWPWPVSRVRKVDVRKVRTLVVGSSVKSGIQTVLWSNEHYESQYGVLTGENIFVEVGVSINYRVQDPKKWFYNCQAPEKFLSNLAEAVIAEEFASRSLMTTITAERAEFKAILYQHLELLLRQYESGIKLENVELLEAHPPLEVADDYEAVVTASIKYETLINQARAYSKALLPKTRGTAKKKMLEARATRARKRNSAEGEAARFKLLKRAYDESPRITEDRMWLETVERAMAGREKIIVPPDAASGELELYMTADPGVIPGTSKEK
ncbi:MAG: FtsH protease activity modulator HflK [bacterium]